MKRSDLKELIKKSMLEVSPTSGAMTPEEEKMVADYEEEEANKYALNKEEPLEEEKKGHYVTVKAKDGSHKSTLTNLPNHADQTYSDALLSIERLKSVDGRKGKKYIYYVSDKDGNPIAQGKEIEEGSVTLNSDEVYAKYAPLVQKYKADGMDKYQAIAQAEKDLARHYGATPMNIATFVDDYSKKQYMGGDEDSIDAFADEREHDVLREADDIVAAYAEKKTLKEADLSQANFNDLNQVVRNIAHVNEVRMEEAAMQAIEYIAEQFDVPVDFKDFN